MALTEVLGEACQRPPTKVYAFMVYTVGRPHPVVIALHEHTV
jgi:hypothetical protein